MDNNLIRNLAIAACLGALTACTAMSTQQSTQQPDKSSPSAQQEPVAAPPVVPYFVRQPVAQQPEQQTSISKGSGIFVRDTAPQATATADETIAETGDITLNFKAADLNEFVRVVFEEILKHEQLVTSLINTLMDTAIEQKDHATNMFLQWFVTEQVEEEANVDEVLQQLKLAKDSKGALFMLDKQMATRTFTPPTAEGGA